MSQDAVYCFDRACVLFAISPEGPQGPRIVAEISEDALRDVFGARGGPESLEQTFRLHFDLIEAAALRRYRHAPMLPIELGIGDFALSATFATDSIY